LVEGNAMEELEKLPQIISGVTDDPQNPKTPFLFY
jgi:hypothetical protein